MMQKETFRLDRTKFKAHSFDSASHQRKFWMQKPVTYRLQAAYYLISIAYGFDLNNPPRLDRTAFSSRKLK
jgi:hypothetical protein